MGRLLAIFVASQIGQKKYLKKWTCDVNMEDNFGDI